MSKSLQPEVSLPDRVLQEQRETYQAGERARAALGSLHQELKATVSRFKRSPKYGALLSRLTGEVWTSPLDEGLITFFLLTIPNRDNDYLSLFSILETSSEDVQKRLKQHFINTSIESVAKEAKELKNFLLLLAERADYQTIELRLIQYVMDWSEQV